MTVRGPGAAADYHASLMPASDDRLQETLRQVQELLARQRALEELTHRQEGPRRDLLEALQHRQNAAELHHRVRGLHPADLASVLETLPPEQRLLLWDPLPPDRAGLALVEMSASVRRPLIQATSPERLLHILHGLDPEDISYLADDLDARLIAEVLGELDATGAAWLRSAQTFEDGSVGRLMSQELVAVREGQNLAAVTAQLRVRGALPPQTDAIYVVDARSIFKGVLPLEALLVRDPQEPLAGALRADAASFAPHDPADRAAKAFERYDLVSAPVVDERGKLVGRITVDAVVDWVREGAERQALRRAGLAGEEDLFAPALFSARNRWVWLSVNLVTAFLASRVIGLFEETITQTVALATLMPVVASVGGNTGNQTVALVVRAIALDRLLPAQYGYLFRKELTVGLLNGVVWGSLMGLVAALLYGRVALGLLMASAVVLNLVVAAIVGVAVPIFLHATGRDPAQGASVLLTFTTDGMGFLIFLGLARLFLT